MEDITTKGGSSWCVRRAAVAAAAASTLRRRSHALICAQSQSGLHEARGSRRSCAGMQLEFSGQVCARALGEPAKQRGRHENVCQFKAAAAAATAKAEAPKSSSGYESGRSNQAAAACQASSTAGSTASSTASTRGTRGEEKREDLQQRVKVARLNDEPHHSLPSGGGVSSQRHWLTLRDAEPILPAAAGRTRKKHACQTTTTCSSGGGGDMRAQREQQSQSQQKRATLSANDDTHEAAAVAATTTKTTSGALEDRSCNQQHCHRRQQRLLLLLPVAAANSARCCCCCGGGGGGGDRLGGRTSKTRTNHPSQRRRPRRDPHGAHKAHRRDFCHLSETLDDAQGDARAAAVASEELRNNDNESAAVAAATEQVVALAERLRELAEEERAEGSATEQVIGQAHEHQSATEAAAAASHSFSLAAGQSNLSSFRANVNGASTAAGAVDTQRRRRGRRARSRAANKNESASRISGQSERTARGSCGAYLQPPTPSAWCAAASPRCNLDLAETRNTSDGVNGAHLLQCDHAQNSASVRNGTRRRPALHSLAVAAAQQEESCTQSSVYVQNPINDCLHSGRRCNRHHHHRRRLQEKVRQRSPSSDDDYKELAISTGLPSACHHNESSSGESRRTMNRRALHGSKVSGTGALKSYIARLLMLVALLLALDGVLNTQKSASFPRRSRHFLQFVVPCQASEEPVDGVPFTAQQLAQDHQTTTPPPPPKFAFWLELVRPLFASSGAPPEAIEQLASRLAHWPDQRQAALFFLDQLSARRPWSAAATTTPPSGGGTGGDGDSAPFCDLPPVSLAQLMEEVHQQQQQPQPPRWSNRTTLALSANERRAASQRRVALDDLSSAPTGSEHRALSDYLLASGTSSAQLAQLAVSNANLIGRLLAMSERGARESAAAGGSGGNGGGADDDGHDDEMSFPPDKGDLASDDDDDDNDADADADADKQRDNSSSFLSKLFRFKRRDSAATAATAAAAAAATQFGPRPRQATRVNNNNNSANNNNNSSGGFDASEDLVRLERALRRLVTPKFMNYLLEFKAREWLTSSWSQSERQNGADSSPPPLNLRDHLPQQQQPLHSIGLVMFNERNESDDDADDSEDQRAREHARAQVQAKQRRALAWFSSLALVRAGQRRAAAATATQQQQQQQPEPRISLIQNLFSKKELSDHDGQFEVHLPSYLAKWWNIKWMPAGGGGHSRSRKPANDLSRSDGAWFSPRFECSQAAAAAASSEPPRWLLTYSIPIYSHASARKQRHGSLPSRLPLERRLRGVSFVNLDLAKMGPLISQCTESAEALAATAANGKSNGGGGDQQAHQYQHYSSKRLKAQRIPSFYADTNHCKRIKSSQCVPLLEYFAQPATGDDYGRRESSPPQSPPSSSFRPGAYVCKCPASFPQISRDERSATRTRREQLIELLVSRVSLNSSRFALDQLAIERVTSVMEQQQRAQQQEGPEEVGGSDNWLTNKRAIARLLLARAGQSSAQQQQQQEVPGGTGKLAASSQTADYNGSQPQQQQQVHGSGGHFTLGVQLEAEAALDWFARSSSSGPADSLALPVAAGGDSSSWPEEVCQRCSTTAEGAADSGHHLSSSSSCKRAPGDMAEAGALLGAGGSESTNLLTLSRFLKPLVLILQVSCILLTLALIGIIMHLRKSRIILLSGWLMLETMLLGALLLYASVLVRYFQPTSLTCLLEPWMRELGFSTFYGSVLIKLYRILTEFQTRKAHRVCLRDKDQIIYLLAIVLIVIGYMSAWTALMVDGFFVRSSSSQTAIGIDGGASTFSSSPFTRPEAALPEKAPLDMSSSSEFNSAAAAAAATLNSADKLLKWQQPPPPPTQASDGHGQQEDERLEHSRARRHLVERSSTPLRSQFDINEAAAADDGYLRRGITQEVESRFHHQVGDLKPPPGVELNLLKTTTATTTTTTTTSETLEAEDAVRVKRASETLIASDSAAAVSSAVAAAAGKSANLFNEHLEILERGLNSFGELFLGLLESEQKFEPQSESFVYLIRCRRLAWDYVTESSEIALLLFGVNLVYKLRNASAEVHKEKLILSLAVFIELIISSAAYLIRHSLWHSLTSDHLLLMYFLRCQLTVTLTVILIFPPKLWEIGKNKPSLLFGVFSSGSSKFSSIFSSSGGGGGGGNSGGAGRDGNDAGAGCRGTASRAGGYGATGGRNASIRHRCHISCEVHDHHLNDASRLQQAMLSNSALEIGSINLADMDPDEIQAELKRVYTQLELLKTKVMRRDNPHISKRRGGRKPGHRKFSLQAFHGRHNPSPAAGSAHGGGGGGGGGNELASTDQQQHLAAGSDGGSSITKGAQQSSIRLPALAELEDESSPVCSREGGGSLRDAKLTAAGQRVGGTCVKRVRVDESLNNQHEVKLEAPPSSTQKKYIKFLFKGKTKANSTDTSHRAGTNLNSSSGSSAKVANCRMQSGGGSGSGGGGGGGSSSSGKWVPDLPSTSSMGGYLDEDVIMMTANDSQSSGELTPQHRTT